jgi:predicted aminopeptidase
MTKQGLGHLSLEWNSVDNEDLLNDLKVKAEVKRKVLLVQKYKKFYYNYFQKEETNIYNETTFLEDKAVTYLVILSKKDQIKAVIHDFPMIGSFPYKGFFSKKDALEFIKDSEKEGFSTYMRPVYAYSTLDRTPFYDNILSSFFLYSDERLAELIFHELTHTLFFIDGEVSLNESLAEIISDDLVTIYYQRSKKEWRFIKKQREKSESLENLISDLSEELKVLYENRTKEVPPADILEIFLKEIFKVRVANHCSTYKIQRCWPLNSKWNNARFAALGTYEKQQNLLEEIKVKNNLDSKEFLSFLKNEYELFDDSDTNSFKSFLKNKFSNN